MSVSEELATPSDIKQREHLPLGLQEFIDYTRWSGKKLSVVGSDEIEGFSGEVPTHFKSETVGLMPNGWLPPAFIPTSVDILADSDFIAHIQQKFVDGEIDPAQPADYLDLLKLDANSINTSYMALEADQIQLPDKAAMKAAILETIKKIKTTIPTADVAPKGLQALEALFTVSNNSPQRLEAEALFLADVCPSLHASIRPKHRMQVTRFVCEWAMIHGITTTSLVFTACISAIWSDDAFNPARAILLPRKGYTSIDGHRAIGRLRKLELLMLTSAALEDASIALLTKDRDLVHFWLALAPGKISHNGQNLRWELRLACPLFKEMRPADYAEVQELFSTAAPHQIDETPVDQKELSDAMIGYKFDRNLESKVEHASAKSKIMNLIRRAKKN
ncbi:hypothetical protein [Pseudomonas putida]|uniref:Uncharacterized protein n=1 Tax=Pseudomonas putida TaxID=303 RepID=A0A8I1JIS3_PSEPU|nr:hypothetical protein [Pseudomonas putida]MBI6883283.1 hypothetical protein [Pseudomonas putida]